MSSTTNYSKSQQNLVDSLHKQQARFVLLANKRPCWKGWQSKRPSVDTVMKHLYDGGDIGIEPASLDALVLDCDNGNPSHLQSHYGEPFATLDSKNRIRAHLWYHSPGNQGNRIGLNVAGCVFDVKSTKGFVLIARPSEQLQRLVDSVINSVYSPLQCELPLVFSDHNNSKPAKASKEKQPRPDPVELKNARPGNRNQSLFNVARHELKDIPYGDCEDTYHAKCLERAKELNNLIPEPLPIGELSQTSYSISTFEWKRREKKSYNHSSLSQRRRWIKVHYDDASDETMRWIDERNNRIVALRNNGYTIREISEKYDLSMSTINRITRKT